MAAMFEETKPSIDQAAIAAAEAATGRRFPAEYVAHLLAYNGGSPEPGSFGYSQPDGQRKRTTVAWFFNVGDHEHENLLKMWRMYGARVPADTLPVARDPGGNLILLGVSGPRRGRILLWDRENEAPENATPWERNVYPVADSLEAFLGMLGPA